MLAVRLTRAARPAVQLRRLLVAVASAGTGFLLLSSLGHALDHPDEPGAAALRLAWCAVPLAATVHFALAVARTDPGTRPRPGLSAVGLGPARLMAVSALTTALSCALGSLLALLFFLHLRGDLTGLPFDGAATDFLAADQPLPVPAALTLLALTPAAASATVALALRPRDPRPAPRGPRGFGRFGAYHSAPAKETFGAYGRFGSRFGGRVPAGVTAAAEPRLTGGPAHMTAAADQRLTGGPAGVTAAAGRGATGGPAAGAAAGPAADGVPVAPGGAVRDAAADPDTGPADGTGAADRARAADRAGTADMTDLAGLAGLAGAGPAAPEGPPAGLPWGVALLTAGLAAQAYAGRSVPAAAAAVLLGWLLTGAGLVVAAPGLAHLCGRLLQSARPGALRLLAGRVLMTEATRIGRPLGVVCAAASAGYALTVLRDGPAPASGPLTALGALVVAGCTVATLFTAAVETRQSRAETTAALLRLGAPAGMLRGAAALRAAALLALFGPLTLLVAALSALPLDR
ncbi:hypothetical protein [Streptomyces sp. NPDC013455]|uniref:hypothetical protein n=1 Tax=Streptomyces sp. NPDC013455 TaxID=3155605 RepID=UPI0033D48C98